MHDQFITLAGKLNKERAPYATAIIVNRTIPSSGKPGDKAIITNTGEIHGWIGGGCTRGIVLKESLLSIRENKPRMVRISPEQAEKDDSNTKLYQMTCQSGGAVDVYIEPVLPKPHLVIFGKSHIAMALCRISQAMEYRVSIVDQEIDQEMFPGAEDFYLLDSFSSDQIDPTSHLIVCTQGYGDEEALFQAIQSGGEYVAFVSSRKKAQSIFTDLRKKGVTIDQLKKVKTPAGLNLHAKRPEEVAISILAEIIKELRSLDSSSDMSAQSKSPEDIILQNDEFYMNPVCNIPVQKSTAKHVINHLGTNIYFCCDGCKIQFEAEPKKYLSSKIK